MEKPEEPTRFVNFSCGHGETVTLHCYPTRVESLVEWWEKKGLCKACYRSRQQAEQEEAQANFYLDLPELEGTEKQIKWSTSIRAKFAAAVTADINEQIRQADLAIREGRNQSHGERINLDPALRKLFSRTEPKFWIDNRDEPVMVLINREHAKLMASSAIHKEPEQTQDLFPKLLLRQWLVDTLKPRGF